MNRTALVLILLVAAIVSARFIDAQTQPVAGLTSTAVITGSTGPPSLFANGTAAAPSIAFSSSPNTGWYLFSAGTLVQDITGANIATWNAAGVVMTGTGIYRWANGDSLQSVDTGIGRNAAGVVEVNNGTAAGRASLTLNNGGGIIFGATTFATLNANAANGTLVFCSDCTLVSAFDQACVGGGTGALAVRQASSWRCFS